MRINTDIMAHDQLLSAFHQSQNSIFQVLNRNQRLARKFNKTLASGNTHFSAARWEKALVCYETALTCSLDPDQSAHVHFLIGRTLAKSDRRPEAVRHFHQALKINPDHPDYRGAALKNLICLGDAKFDAGRWDEAVASYKAALATSLDPDQLNHAHSQLGRTLIKSDRRVEAAGHFEQALKIKPDHQGCRSAAFKNLICLGDAKFDAGRWDEAVASYKAALATGLDPDQLARAHSQIGRTLVMSDRRAEAAHHFEQALKFKPERHDYRSAAAKNLICLGDAKFDAGRGDEAVQAYKTALAIGLGPDQLAQPHFLIGRTLAKSGRRAEAADHFNQALKLNPDHQDCRSAAFKNLICLGDANFDAGKWDEAVQAYETALAIGLGPDQLARSHFLIGRTLAKSDRRAEAVRHFDQALKIKSDHQDCRSAAFKNLTCLGDANFNAGRWDVAIQFYQTAAAIGFDPDQLAYAHILIGRVLTKIDRHAEAGERFALALQIKPGDRGYQDAAIRNLHFVGDTHSAQQRWEDALQAYQAAFAINPNDARTCVRIGELLFKTDRRLSAAVYFDRAVNSRYGGLDVKESAVKRLFRLKDDLDSNQKHEDSRKIFEVILALNPQSQFKTSDYDGDRPYRFMSNERLRSIVDTYSENRSTGSKDRCAIYSCITGAHDPVMPHEDLIKSSDYHMFLDDAKGNTYAFDVKETPYFDDDSARSARYVKTHPHILLPGYEIAVWIDGNILIRNDLSDLIERFAQSGFPVGGIPHPVRTSVYGEAEACIRKDKDDPDVIRKQMSRYEAEGFECDDLVETNLLMFRLDHPKLSSFLNIWWSEIEKGSRRDQLSFNYSLRKADADYFRLTTRPDSVHNHPALAWFKHGYDQVPDCSSSALPARPKRKYADVMNARAAAQAERKVDVIVCVHDALESVKPCLTSVAECRNPERHRIIIVNDGSSAETAEWLEGFAGETSNTELISRAQPCGYTSSANLGLREMAPDADLAILLNSDTVVARSWIEKLLDTAFTNPGIGVVGPLSSAASHQSVPNHKGTKTQTAINDLPSGYTVADMNRWCEENSPEDFVPRVPLIHGFCFALTREAIEKVGYFDEENFPDGFGEENDYCFRVSDAGLSL
ncbi:tetratricopeptide repeat protein, partial [uncultured Roseibium sp.]|uniref:tetratricopeptide repeat protein n=1 Tax=uncultured Roseibium sp. TaxID=1936171 RepID=UPI003217F66C